MLFNHSASNRMKSLLIICSKLATGTQLAGEKEWSTLPFFEKIVTVS